MKFDIDPSENRPKATQKHNAKEPVDRSDQEIININTDYFTKTYAKIYGCK